MWVVIAPGPSMSADLAQKVRGHPLIAVGNTYELAPWADCLVANDRRWWTKHPEAMAFAGRKCSANRIEGVEIVNPCTFGSSSNSGVLALDLARNLGAKTIVMLGFDMHGTHYFGPYTNGCANTPDRRRGEHLLQFRDWVTKNKGIRVVNCTPGSRIKAIPFEPLWSVIG